MRPGRGAARPLLALAFAAAVALTGLQLFRTVRDARYWNAHRDEPIAGWMTVGFVAHSYHVPPYVLERPLGLTPGPPPDRRPLGVIAAAQGRSVAQVAALLGQAIVHARPPYPPPMPPAPRHR